MALSRVDSTTNNNTLTNVNTVTSVTTALPFATCSGSADFEEGSSQYLQASDSVPTSVTGNFTIAFWVKFESLPDDTWRGFVGKGADGSTLSYQIRHLRLGGVGKLKIDISGTGADYARVAWNWDPSTGVWYHIAVNCTIANANSSKFIWYLNGSSQGNGTVELNDTVSSIYDSAQGLRIGQASQPMDGQIADVRLYNSVITDFTNRSEYISPATSGLQANWRLGEEGTLILQPVAGANSPVDGYVERNGVNETFGTIRAGAGVSASATTANQINAGLYASATTDQFARMIRSFFCFDTSVLPDTATITAATFSFVATAKFNEIGSPAVHLAGGTLGSTADVTTSDYGGIARTTFGNIAYASITADASTYNAITLNSDGLAAISKTGITTFSNQTDWDINNNFTGAWSSGGGSQVSIYYADQGITVAPKLTITYTEGSSGPRKLAMMGVG